ncbi:MAG: tripartite tricarboxylate transporter TctB family protein [Chloroflexota bacterium]|nr:tripartite tricarboxylate transporter TctB family protein [Chloroflexota bacterium]
MNGGSLWGRVATAWAPTVAATVSLLLAIGYLVKDQEYPLVVNGQRGAGLYPFLIGIFWAAGSVACLREAWRDRARGVASIVPELDWPDRAGWARTAVALAAAAAYVSLIGTLGDLVMDFIVMAGVMLAMGVRRPLQLVVVAAVVAIVAHVVFVTALNVPMPRGVLGIG